MGSRDRRRLAINYARELFIKNPNKTVDEVAKLCANQGLTLHRDVVSDVRKDVRAKLSSKPETAPSVILDTVAQPTAPRRIFVRPTLVPPTPLAAKVVEPASMESPVKVEMDKTVASALKDTDLTDVEWRQMHNEAIDGASRRMIRKRYLNAWLERHPGTDAHTIAGEMRTVLGKALGIAYIYETCRVARDVSKLPQIPSRTSREQTVTQQTEAKETEIEMADSGMRLLTWMNNGQPQFQMVQKPDVHERVMTLMYRDGVDKKDIQLWKPAQMGVNVSIDIE